MITKMAAAASLLFAIPASVEISVLDVAKGKGGDAKEILETRIALCHVVEAAAADTANSTIDVRQYFVEWLDKNGFTPADKFDILRLCIAYQAGMNAARPIKTFL